MSLVLTIKEDIKNAMREKNAVALTALRGVSSAFTNELITQGKMPGDEITDELAITVLKREVKRRKDAIEQFLAGGREDLAEDDKAEIEVLAKYLPENMSIEKITEIAKAKMTEMGITDKSKMGQLMGAIIKEAGSSADGGDVKTVVESLLA